MSNWTFGHLDIWNVQGLGLIYIIIIIIIYINYYFYQNRHLDELKSPKVQKSDLYFENENKLWFSFGGVVKFPDHKRDFFLCTNVPRNFLLGNELE